RPGARPRHERLRARRCGADRVRHRLLGAARERRPLVRPRRRSILRTARPRADMGTPRSVESTRSVVWVASAASFLLVAQQVAGKAVRDALFLSNYTATALPPVMVASSLASVLAVIVFSRIMARRSPFQVAPLATALASLLLLGEWGLTFQSPRLAAVLVYL